MQLSCAGRYCSGASKPKGTKYCVQCFWTQADKTLTFAAVCKVCAVVKGSHHRQRDDAAADEEEEVIHGDV